MRNHRGFVDPVTLYVLAGLAAGIFVGSWKPLNMFRKPPPTQQLTELQAKLDAQQAEGARVLRELEAAKLAERAKLEAQIRSAQQDNAGTVAALAKVKPSSLSPEVKLASRMAQRVTLKLAAAIGRLPQEEQDAMVDLIDQALSDKQSEVDEANRKLAEMDDKFRLTTKERDSLKMQAEVLLKESAESKKAIEETQRAVTTKTEEVKAWANKFFAADQANGSLWSSIERVIFIVGGIIAFFMFGIPAIVKHLESDNPLKSVLRDANGYFLNPLTYHDAKKKLAELQKQP